MASIVSENSVGGDLIIFRRLLPYVPHLNLKSNKHYENLICKGLLQIDSLVEEAIATQSGVDRAGDSTVEIGYDFENGWEAKKVVAVESEVPTTCLGWKTTRTERRATVKNLIHKTGDVLIVAADVLSNDVYYFKVPQHEIRKLRQKTKLANFAIVFDPERGGPPKSFNKRNGSRKNNFQYRLWNWYRKKSFPALCKN